MNGFELDWSKVWQFMAVGAPMALVRTLISKSHRNWDSFLANLVAACLVSPIAGLWMVEWRDDHSTPQVEGLAFAFVAATAVSFLGVDLLRGLLNLGEAFAKNPVSILKDFGTLWTGRSKRDADE